MQKPSANQIIDHMNLQYFHQGGYYKVLHITKQKINTETDSQSESINSIHYMLTKDQPLGYWHFNKSNIQFYHQMGCSVLYRILYENGEYQQIILGQKVSQGQKLVFAINGPHWKCAEILEGQTDFSLSSQVSDFGFNQSGQSFAEKQNLIQAFPNVDRIIFERFCKNRE